MNSEQGLDEWLKSTQKKRDELADYGRSPISTDMGERQLDLDRAIQNSDEAGRLRADADLFLTQSTAEAWLEVCKNYDESPVKIREAVVKNKVRYIQRLVDGIAITERTIRNRIYASMNKNRSR